MARKEVPWKKEYHERKEKGQDLPECPVKNNPQYREDWYTMLFKVIDRENYHYSHLKTLQILCDLLRDYRYLSEQIEIEGMNYSTEGRYGSQQKPTAAYSQRQQIVKDIATYTKLLDIVLKKDTSANAADDGEEW